MFLGPDELGHVWVPPLLVLQGQGRAGRLPGTLPEPNGIHHVRDLVESDLLITTEERQEQWEGRNVNNHRSNNDYCIIIPVLL